MRQSVEDIVELVDLWPTMQDLLGEAKDRSYKGEDDKSLFYRTVILELKGTVIM